MIQEKLGKIKLIIIHDYFTKQDCIKKDIIIKKGDITIHMTLIPLIIIMNFIVQEIFENEVTYKDTTNETENILILFFYFFICSNDRLIFVSNKIYEHSYKYIKNEMKIA